MNLTIERATSAEQLAAVRELCLEYAAAIAIDLETQSLTQEFAELPPNEECSALHSTDYGGEAWYFIDTYMPEQLESLRARVAELNGKSAAPMRRAA